LSEEQTAGPIPPTYIMVTGSEANALYRALARGESGEAAVGPARFAVLDQNRRLGRGTYLVLNYLTPEDLGS
jgi:hypothetical protein